MRDIFLIDFDGTISFNDSTQLLAREFIPDMYDDYLNKFREGKVNVKIFINDLLSSLNIDKSTFENTLKEKIIIDSTFKDFVDKGIEYRIVSAGSVLNVISGLKSIGLTVDEELIYSNSIKFNGRNIEVDFPYLDAKEDTGVDKAGIIEKYKKLGYRVIFVGDGPSDYPAIEVADIVFAKKGKRLVDRCNEKEIEFMEFDDFDDIYTQYANYLL